MRTLMAMLIALGLSFSTFVNADEVKAPVDSGNSASQPAKATTQPAEKKVRRHKKAKMQEQKAPEKSAPKTEIPVNP